MWLLSRHGRLQERGNENMSNVTCSLCNWSTDIDNEYGKARHEEWHNGKNADKHASKNKIWGEVVWIES